MQDKTVSYEELIPGYEFPSANYEMSAALVSKYIKAVDSPADGFVPPLAITACAIAAMAQALSLPPGAIAIHASQELEFFKLVPIGATIECHTRVARKITRGKMSMLILELDVFDQSKEKVQSGKATIALPT
jgi:acyl dehydratase